MHRFNGTEFLLCVGMLLRELNGTNLHATTPGKKKISAAYYLHAELGISEEQDVCITSGQDRTRTFFSIFLFISWQEPRQRIQISEILNCICQ